METQAIIYQFQQLPAEAQRIVAELIELLSRQATPGKAAVEKQATGATILPPLDISKVPMTWPENEFMNPEFYGAWAGREDMKDGGAAYIHRVRRGLQPPKP
jgi:hypothetical protein